MRIFLSLIPWILYFTLSGFQYIEIAPLIAVIATILFSYQELGKKYILALSTLIYFAGLTVLYLLPLRDWLSQYALQFSNFVLPLIMWVSILVRHPFTLQYARDRVGKDYKETPRFRTMNYAISTVWALGLLSMAIMNLLQYLQIITSHWLVPTTSVVALAFAFLFSEYFPSWYMKRPIRS